MPYIPKEQREEYDRYVDHLANLLNLRTNDVLAGELNYIIYRLAIFLCDEKVGGECRYARMATVLSAMSEAQAEFRRRVLGPYEDKAIEKNGDVII